MTEKEIEQYLRKVQNVLNLNHWAITVFFEDEAPRGEVAICHPEYEYCKAKIYFYRDVFKNDLTLKKNIIHELVHCHFAFAWNWLRDLERYMDDTKEEVTQDVEVLCHLSEISWMATGIRTNQLQNEEQSVELLARAIYDLLEK